MPEPDGFSTIPAGSDPGAGGILTIDLAAIVANYRHLCVAAAPAACSAVLKADGYGLGAVPVGRALLRAGCRHVFVAHAAEGVALRAGLGPDVEIAILHGAMPGEEPLCLAHTLVPVLNSLDQIAAWVHVARERAMRLPAMLQLDTGMTRFGLSEADCAQLNGIAGWPEAIDLTLVMSHLACADTPAHPANEIQRLAFARMRAGVPAVPASLAASSGIFLGPAFCLDRVRPGAALFGVAPRPGEANPLQAVVRLQGRVAQMRDVPAGAAVGYGWTARTERPARLATVAIGYADGFLRSLSGTGAAFLDGTRLPILGRVSMDSVVLDVTALPRDALRAGELVDFLGPDQGLDALAAAAGTIGYEILTAFGQRYERRYIGC